MMKEYLKKRKEYIESIIQIELKKCTEDTLLPHDLSLFQCNLSEWTGRSTEIDLCLSFLEKFEEEKKYHEDN